MNQEQIRIGTMAGKGPGTAEYIEKILPHGFESFQINFRRSLQGVDLERLADEVNSTLSESGAVVSSLGVYGNGLEENPEDFETRRAWELLIEHAHLFGTDLVCGFTGRVRGRPVPESLPRFGEVFGELARRAMDSGVRLAFENCPMGGSWSSGEFNIAFNPTAWEMIFNQVEATNVGLEWEPCHQLCQLIEPLPQLKKYLPKIFHVHGKDATIHSDVLRESGTMGLQPFVEHRHPGFGDSDWTAIISELRRGGYQGAIDIEGWHDPVYCEELEMTGQVFALRYLKRCRGEFVPNPEGF